MQVMSAVARKMATLARSFPPDKAKELLEYARYLDGKADEERGDHLFSDPKYRSMLQKDAARALKDHRAGLSRPLDPDRV